MYLQVPLNDGQHVILLEVKETEDGFSQASRAGDIIERLKPGTLEQGLDHISALARETLIKLRELPELPDVISVECGIKVAAKFGVVVAESTGEAHLIVKAEWHRSRD